MKTTINTMCPDCTRFGKDCQGTSCQTWTGCIYKKRTDADKTICKPKLIYQPDAPEDARYNVQLWHSYDGGKTFYYAGHGRFFKDFYEAEAWRKQQRKNLSYDLMFGRLGNGTTVCNMAREEHGDYPTIAHIDDCGAVRWYVDAKRLPPYVLEDVNAAALRDMAEFKEKFLKLTPLEALRAVYDTFPMNTIQNDISKKTVPALYEIYTEFMAQHGYMMPEQ